MRFGLAEDFLVIWSWGRLNGINSYCGLNIKVSTSRLTEAVRRWEHKVNLDPREPEGCGYPVCVIVDARPKRFVSLCNFTAWAEEMGLTRRVFELQKGGCEDVSELLGSLIFVRTERQCTHQVDNQLLTPNKNSVTVGLLLVKCKFQFNVYKSKPST